MIRFSTPVVAAVAVGAVTLFVAKMVANRQFIGKLRAAGMPMPPHHQLFGHLIALKECIQALPRNTVMHVVVRRMARQYPNGVFYLNLWPFNSPIVVVINPFMASQVEAAFLNKPAHMCATLEIINGGPSLQTMHGATWKEWRSLLNPGFAPSYMTKQASALADEVMVFCELLQDRARDARLYYQTQESALADCLRRQVYWTLFGTSFNPFRRYLSPRPIVQRYNSYRMNQYLDSEIDKRFEELALARAAPKDPNLESRSIISLAMNKYLEELEDSRESSKKAFKRFAKPQLRMFLYAGHDTTSSTLLYCYHLLSSYPAVMAKVRDEHDREFGSGPTAANVRQAIASDPARLNQITYTMAVIKEVLRLFPPAASLRDGRPDLFLTDERGQRYPTKGRHIWVLSLAMHHSPDLFVKPEQFIPDPWLVGSDHPLYPKKASWRAFEWGPRNCIGQTLAQLELKVALVMTARLFDITPAYDEWDKLYPRKGVQTVDENRVYQAEMGGGGAHSVDRFPVRVTVRI